MRSDTEVEELSSRACQARIEVGDSYQAEMTPARMAFTGIAMKPNDGAFYRRLAVLVAAFAMTATAALADDAGANKST